MDQPENKVSLHYKLKKVLDSETRELLHYSAYQNDNINWLRGSNIHSFLSSQLNLELTFSIEKFKDLKEESVKLETAIIDMASSANGVFMGRNINAAYRDNEASTIVYRLRLSSFELLEASLEKAYRTKVDEEFTKQLEAKLSED